MTELGTQLVARGGDGQELGVLDMEPGRSATLLTDTAGLVNRTWTEEDVAVIRNTVAKGATDPELRVFLALAAAYELDPFLNEIWCYKMLKANQRPEDEPAIIAISFEGHLKVAARSPGYMGPPTFGVVREHDNLVLDYAAQQVVRHRGSPIGAIVGAWATMERMVGGEVRRRLAYVPWGEASRGTPVWKNNPSQMMAKVPQSYVTARLFPVPGVVSGETLGDPDVPTGNATVTVPAALANPDSQALAAAMDAAARAILLWLGYSQRDVTKRALEYFDEEADFLAKALLAPAKDGGELDPLVPVRLLLEQGLAYEADGWKLDDDPPSAEELLDTLQSAALVPTPTEGDDHEAGDAGDAGTA